MDPFKLTEEFSNILANKIIATGVVATFILHHELWVFWRGEYKFCLVFLWIFFLWGCCCDVCPVRLLLWCLFCEAVIFDICSVRILWHLFCEAVVSFVLQGCYCDICLWGVVVSFVCETVVTFVLQGCYCCQWKLFAISLHEIVVWNQFETIIKCNRVIF